MSEPDSVTWRRIVGLAVAVFALLVASGCATERIASPAYLAEHCQWCSVAAMEAARYNAMGES